MEVKNACTKCGCINTVDVNSLLRKDVTDKDGNHYRLLCFKCEQCKSINVVQIDNNETRQLYRTFKSLLVKVMKKRVKHETISPKDIKKKDKYTKTLSQMREELKQRTNGATMYDEDGNVFVEHLSFVSRDMVGDKHDIV